jgi:hypothetical protein
MSQLPPVASLTQYISREVPVPDMDGRTLYRTTADDAGTIIVAQVTSLQGNVKTRLIAGPIEIDPQVS